MARQPRFKIAGVAQLITQRGNNNQAVFFSEQDYLCYLDILNEAAEIQQCQIHAFVLMSNYIHILATPTMPDGISQLMKSVGQRYVSYINRLEKRSGTLWQGRYKASLVESGQYLLACMRYIEMTPVRTTTVKTPKNYKWSSYRANAYGDKVNVQITNHDAYTELARWSDKNDNDTQEAYKQFLREQEDVQELQKITKISNSCTIYGSEKFQQRIKDRGLTPIIKKSTS